MIRTSSVTPLVSEPIPQPVGEKRMLRRHSRLSKGSILLLFITTLKFMGVHPRRRTFNRFWRNATDCTSGNSEVGESGFDSASIWSGALVECACSGGAIADFDSSVIARGAIALDGSIVEHVQQNF